MTKTEKLGLIFFISGIVAFNAEVSAKGFDNPISVIGSLIFACIGAALFAASGEPTL